MALDAEQSRNVSFDLTRTTGPLSYTVTLFASRISDPIDVARDDGFVLTNAPEPTLNVGGEFLATLRQAPFALTANYAYVRSREYDAGALMEAPLTPRHSAGLVGIWEREGVARIGVEWYFTGAQRLETNPFRARSRPYQLFGVMAERQLGRVRLFINGENLTSVRQTRWDALLRPSQAPDGRWTVDGWAPLEGRNINAGIRLRFQ
jgi:iron complex outermembrane receptor protein